MLDIFIALKDKKEAEVDPGS